MKNNTVVCGLALLWYGCQGRMSAITVTRPVVELGALEQGEQRDIRVSVRNSGQRADVLAVAADCDCLKWEGASIYVPAGGEIEMRGTLTANGEGRRKVRTECCGENGDEVGFDVSWTMPTGLVWSSRAVWVQGASPGGTYHNRAVVCAKGSAESLQERLAGIRVESDTVRLIFSVPSRASAPGEDERYCVSVGLHVGPGWNGQQAVVPVIDGARQAGTPAAKIIIDSRVW